MTEVYILNAFSATAEGGNPAGVVTDANSMTEEQMQEVARELGHSETAFVQTSDVADFKVRFFTPVAEVDLCGHATIATFSLLFHLKKIESGKYFQETRAGVFDVDITESGKIFMTQSEPLFGDEVDKQVIARSLNISIEDLHPDLKPQIVSTGLRDIIVPIKDLETLMEIKPDFAQVCALSKELDVIGYHLFSLETVQNVTASCRNFAPLFGIDEEAATGTASGALSCYLFSNKIISEAEAANLIYEQGQSMNRFSRIEARLDIFEGRINRVEAGGVAHLLEQRAV
ncbi:MAG: PhzF family phenazine biosynthesis protein [Candidatus Obscuribacterales bacterium]|nr:PhzF family phenazine biosynthesis protein [Candidatus Obscuribacterales bacterium]